MKKVLGASAITSTCLALHLIEKRMIFGALMALVIMIITSLSFMESIGCLSDDEEVTVKQNNNIIRKLESFKW